MIEGCDRRTGGSRNEFIWMAYGLLLAATYTLPMIWLGQDAHVRIHDNLDSNVVWYKTLVATDHVYAPLDANVPLIMDGQVARNAFVSEWTGILRLYQWLPTYPAYVASQVITRLCAFLGMYLLLRDHLALTMPRRLYWLVAVLFAWTPFWPSGMLSTLGMPLSLWAFLNLWHGRRKGSSLAVVLLLPFYSSFVLGMFFFLAALGLGAFIRSLKERRVHVAFWAAYLGQTLLFLLIEYRLVYAMLLDPEPTSRDEFELGTNPFGRTVLLFLKNVVVGHTHDRSAQAPFLLLAVLFVLFLAKGNQRRRFASLLGVTLALSFWYAGWFDEAWNPVKQHWSLLRTFNFARFHFLQPMLWYVLFAVALQILWDGSRKRWVAFFLFGQAVTLIIWNPEIIYRDMPTYRQFYAERQLEAIKEEIKRPIGSYRVVSLGMHPAIAQYNGLATLDGYVNFYPLSYKHAFREIIGPELEKDELIRDYYDRWGNRCYVFSAELGKEYLYTSSHQRVVRDLTLDSEAMRHMGAEYMLSAVDIANANALGLRLERTFQDPASAWTIRLYRLEAKGE